MSDDFKAILAASPLELDGLGMSTIGLAPAAYLTPYILGLFLDCMLLGVLVMQANRWHTFCYKAERWVIRLLVFYVVLLNIGITIFLMVWNFEMFVYNFGRYRQFFSIEYASFFYLIDALVRFPVSTFFAERAYRMSGSNKILGAVLMSLLLASFALGVTAKAIATTMYGTPTFIILSCVWLSCHLACDVTTTTVIAVFLYRSKTGWSQTDALMMQLLVMTAETQLPPTILSTAFLITYVSNAATSWPIFFVFSAKVFAICLIAVLNTKFTLRRELETASTNGGNNTYALKSRGKQPTIQVMVQTETYRARDDEISGLETEIKRKRGHGNELDVSYDSDGGNGNDGFKKLPDVEEDSIHTVPIVRFDRAAIRPRLGLGVLGDEQVAGGFRDLTVYIIVPHI